MLTLSPGPVLRFRARRSALDRSAPSPLAAAEAVAALHATDPATIHLSVWARTPSQPLDAIGGRLRAAFEQERTLVRVLAMRRTLHVVPVAEAAAALGIAVARIGPTSRRLAHQLLVAGGLAAERSAAAAFDRLADEVLDALAEGDLPTDELCRRVPALGTRVHVSPDKPWGTAVPVVRYVLEAMGSAGLVIRARALGGWRASGSSWARLDRWLPDLAPLPLAEAAAGVLRAWLRAFGPATLDDAAWWLGLPKRDVTAARRALGAALAEVEVEGWEGHRWVLSEDLDALSDAARAGPVGVALLPALDPSAMAVTDRRPFLDPTWRSALFDRSGNIAPTIWADGRVIGGWACRRDGDVAFRILDALAAEHADAVAAEAGRLREALGGEVVQPRFPTPLTRELGAT